LRRLATDLLPAGGEAIPIAVGITLTVALIAADAGDLSKRRRAVRGGCIEVPTHE
jgi:hypothetical protein